MARRNVTPTNFAFLDIMFCGFGAVVLLVLILNGDVLQRREQHSQDLRAELKRVTALEEFARGHMERLVQQIQTADLRQGELKLRSERLQTQIRETSKKTKKAETRAATLGSSIASLQVQGSALQNAVRLMRSKLTKKWQADKRPVGFTGDGRRQYLTGLKLGAERTLILLDSSASMLDETIVNIVRRKFLPPIARRTAPKWQRVLRTFHWLIANLRPGKKFQVYEFSSGARALVPGTEGRWLSTDDVKQLGAALRQARQIAPLGGTSLHRAFEVINKLRPRPDSVILLTDGLPTQGGFKESARLVSAPERLEFFNESARKIPNGTPINTLLFPMEGDPDAAGAFWRLAITTKGSFITPSRDWP